jgi:hypothetical protein
MAMTRRLLRLALTAAVFVVAVPVSALAQAGTVIDWGPDSYAWETGYNAASHLSAAGSQLSAVGVINGFLGPLAADDPNTPGTEYTYYLTGLTTAAGTTVTVGPTLSVYKTIYTGGTIVIYKGSPRNAAFGTNPPNATVPSTFIDGALYLSGTIPSFTTTVTRTNATGAYVNGAADSGDPANGTWTGGSALPRVSVASSPCPWRLTGGWDMRPTDVLTGYVSQYDGKIDLNCPTPALPSTWGKVKSTYRD